MSKPKYINPKEICYYSHRYNRMVTVKKGETSDGATGAFDIDSISWWVHDQLCNTGKFDDGSPCTNWQASWVLSDILWSEKYWFRSVSWGWMTFIFGCDKCRDNGMVRMKKLFKL